MEKVNIDTSRQFCLDLYTDEFGVDIIDLKTKPYQGSVLENGLFTKAQCGR